MSASAAFLISLVLMFDIITNVTTCLSSGLLTEQIKDIASVSEQFQRADFTIYWLFMEKTISWFIEKIIITWSFNKCIFYPSHKLWLQFYPLIDKTKPLSTFDNFIQQHQCHQKKKKKPFTPGTPPSSDRWITVTQVMQLLCFMLQAVIFSNNYIVVWPALPQISCYEAQEQSFDQYLKGNTQHNYEPICGYNGLVILKGI